MHSNNYLDEENRDTKHLSLKKSLMMLMSIRISRMTVFLQRLITKTLKTKKLRGNLSSREEKSNILNNKLLSDESIDLAQQLLKKQFPIFGSLQDIALSKHYGS